MNQAERWKWLLDGGKLKQKGGDVVVFLRDGYLFTEHTMCTYSLNADEWEKFVEPKVFEFDCYITQGASMFHVPDEMRKNNAKYKIVATEVVE